jgi:hypothetical protein
MNGLAAPDVRAPSVCGRWHFLGTFGPFPFSSTAFQARLGMAFGCGYTLAP